MKKYLMKISRIDRRIIFLFVFLSIILPFLPGFGFLKMGVETKKETLGVFNYIESLKPGDNIFYDWSFGPSTKAELLPFTEAFLKHCFHKKLNVLIYYSMAQGISMGENTIEKITNLPEFKHLEKNKDYIHLGYLPIGGDMILMSMTTNVKSTFKKEGAIFDDIQTLSDMDYVFIASGTGYPQTYVDAQLRFGYKFGMDITSVMSPEFIPYFQTGQANGIINGLRGAAEYEALIQKQYGSKDRKYLGSATQGLASLTFSHLVVIFFLILANVIYFTVERKKGGR